MTTVDSPPAATTRADLDAAVDAAVERIRSRMLPFGGAFADLADELHRATAGGKRFRPALVLAAADAFGGTADPARWQVAAAFELLHAAFLVHDDLIDHDTLRRGVPNVAGAMRERALARGSSASRATQVADAAALLAGDLLLHEAQRLIATAPSDERTRIRLLDLLDEAVLVSAAGELADVAHASLSETPATAAVLAATHDKTAVYSFAAPLRAGAALAGADADADAALAECGSRLGLAYQLADDLIGTFGSPAQAGRDAGADLREGKHTALIALAREQPTWPDLSRTLAAAPTGPIAVRHAQRALEGTGVRDELERLIRGALAEAREAARAGELPAAAIELVDELADSVAGRIP